MESRRRRSSRRRRGDLDWPGVEPVCVLGRVRRVGGVEQRETVLAITSLTPGEASACRRLGLARGHWGIGNEWHRVQDVVLGAAACGVRPDGGPRILSGLGDAA